MKRICQNVSPYSYLPVMFVTPLTCKTIPEIIRNRFLSTEVLKDISVQADLNPLQNSVLNKRL